MPKYIDITGKKFNKLTAIEFVYRNGTKYFWKFRCDCGKEVVVEKYSATNGGTKSCGCYSKEFHSKEKIKINNGDIFGRLLVLNYIYTKNNKKYYKCKCSCGNYCIKDKKYLLHSKSCSCGCLKSEESKKIQLKNCKTHGLSRTKLYSRWNIIKNRCYDEKNIGYKNYGGRGIKLCDEWKNNFSNFYDWALKNGYKDNLTIDRIDCDGNYCPENCRWVNMKIQNNNRRNNHLITINGETKTLSLWLKYYNISDSAYYNRLKNGMSEIEALTKKKDEKKVRIFKTK